MTTGKIVEKINERIVFLAGRQSRHGEDHSNEIRALGRAKIALMDYFGQPISH